MKKATISKMVPLIALVLVLVIIAAAVSSCNGCGKENAPDDIDATPSTVDTVPDTSQPILGDVFEINDVLRDNDDGTVTLVITGTDIYGNTVWKYDSPQCKNDKTANPLYIGEKNGIVYLACNEPTDNSGSRVIALNAADGKETWTNTDYTGANAYATLSEDGTLYIGSPAGKDVIAISAGGQTLWEKETLDENLIDPYSIKLVEDDVVVICYKKDKITGDLNVYQSVSEGGEVGNG